MASAPLSRKDSNASKSTNPLLPLLRQQVELQEKNLQLQKQLIQAIETAHKDTSEGSVATVGVSSRPESTASQREDMEPLLEANELKANTPTLSAFRMYCSFLLSGDGLKCFTEHPGWEEITTESMSAPRIREKIISTLETLMVFYTLMLTIGVGVLQSMSNVALFADLLLLCLSYAMASLSFMATTIALCVLKMVLAVSDCNLKLWCKANSHVFILMSTIHNLITISTILFMMLLFCRALPVDTFPMSVEIGVRVGVVVFALAMTVVTGASVCAPARSAAHTGATSELPICSDAASTQASPEDAMRILYHEAFEPKLDKLVDFYRSGGGQEENTPASDEVHVTRRGGMVKRRTKQNV